MCKGLQLTHFTFVGDLMIFCKRSKQAVDRVMKTIKCCSTTTRLIANNEKSNIFIADISKTVKVELIDITGYSLGSLPIIYPIINQSH